MKRLFDVQLPFFIPLWRRIVLVVLCLGWALVEWRGDNQLWAVLFGTLGVYCAHQFFFAFDPKGAPTDPDTDEGGSS